jgi:hypothetical protein
MQKSSINKETSVVYGCDKFKSAWQCPTISRIDIKRTMSGSAGAIDAINGTIPST